ncbi:unnamed protein product [Prorocentrum cordatum]|uniref:H(+)-exporting diphosphatase n=1 Tax=Prorocentrum cordatum TaxID=2364126 RepID=A0ABN9TR03_9DINO|nr:unnamed protein product [Polarella glacialis]
MTLAMLTPCNSEDTTVILIVTGLVGLVLTFGGYLIYHFAIGLFGFFVGFLAEAAVGSLWLGKSLFQVSHAGGSESELLQTLTSSDDSDSRVKMKVIVLACCLIWGMIAAVTFQKLSSTINKLLGYALGAALGVGTVALLIHAVNEPINEAAGPAYAGWESFATISLGVPTALVTGYLARNSIKYCIMLATAFGGAAIVVGTSMRALECADVELGAVSKPIGNALIVAGLATLGFAVQLKVQPKAVREHDGLPAANCA